MNKQNINHTEVNKFIAGLVHGFHAKRIERLRTLNISEIIRRLNPLLLLARGEHNAEVVIKREVDFLVAQSEKTVFGNYVEQLAIFINAMVYGGKKSGISGIDLEFDKDDVRYIVAIKSSPEWGNHSHVSKLKADFSTAKRALRTSNSKLKIIAVNGCGYGYESSYDKGEYLKLCGQRFWELISGDSEIYTTLIKPFLAAGLPDHAVYLKEYNRTINRLINDFDRFCKIGTSEMNWEQLMRYNSGQHNGRKKTEKCVVCLFEEVPM